MRIGDKTEDVTYSRTDIGDGNEKIEVTGPSSLSRISTILGLTAQTLMRRAAIFAAGAAGMGAAFGAQRSASGSLMLDTSTDSAHQAMAQPYIDGGALGNAVYVNIHLNGTEIGYGSGVLLDPTHVLTAAHNTISASGVNATLTVGNGNNFATNPGTIVSVTNVVVDPNFNRSNLVAGTDQAILTLSSPLPMYSSNAMGTMNVGDVLVGVGVGNYGSPSAGEFTQNGAFRAFNAPMTEFGDAGLGVSSQYGVLQFSDAYSSIYPMNGKGLSGDSGGPVYNSLGQLVGIMDDQSGGANLVGTTEVDSLDTSFINSNTSATPEPTSAILFIAGGALILLRRSRRLEQ